MSFAQWRMERRARSEARARLRQVRGVVKDQAFRLGAPLREKIDLAAARLATALTAKDHDATCRGLIELDELAAQHLTFPGKSTFREYAESIAIAVLIALFLRAFVVEAYKIPSGSMIPTMQVGDHIFVNKFLYGLRIPFTNTKLFSWRKPKRGEVIVFIYPKDPDKDYIKRVIGLEGDHLRVRSNQIFLNGKPIERRAMPGNCENWDYNEQLNVWQLKRCARFDEVLDGEHYTTIDEIGQPMRDFPDADDDDYVVPKDSVFMMGDNRDNSSDSRVWGNLPLVNIRGKAMVIWWSAGSPEEGIRWSRVGHIVE